MKERIYSNIFPPSFEFTLTETILSRHEKVSSNLGLSLPSRGGYLERGNGRLDTQDWERLAEDQKVFQNF